MTNSSYYIILLRIFHHTNLKLRDNIFVQRIIRLYLICRETKTCWKMRIQTKKKCKTNARPVFILGVDGFEFGARFAFVRDRRSPTARGHFHAEQRFAGRRSPQPLPPPLPPQHRYRNRHHRHHYDDHRAPNAPWPRSLYVRHGFSLVRPIVSPLVTGFVTGRVHSLLIFIIGERVSHTPHSHTHTYARSLVRFGFFYFPRVRESVRTLSPLIIACRVRVLRLFVFF